MRKLSFVIGAVLALGVVAAHAQVFLPRVPNVNANDAIQVIPQGQPSAQSFYATPAQIAGAPGYVLTTPLTGFSLTYAQGQTSFILTPAGTLATGTLITEANPSDGQRECVMSSQTQTALTVTANTGQTFAAPPTALVANTPVCWTFVRASSAWFRSP